MHGLMNSLDQGRGHLYDEEMKVFGKQAVLLRIIVVALWITSCALPANIFANEPTNIWDTMRSHFSLDTALSDHPMVEDKINNYLRYPGYLEKVLARSRPYLYFVVNEINKRGLPTELALVPFVESEFLAHAKSGVGAKGFWQLMPGTALGMNVHMNHHYDGRQDIVESTKAALDYLTYLYHFFDEDWVLAIAAYDAGAGRIQKSIRNHESFLGIPPTIWDLSLPRETHHYLPKILALKAMIQQPERYQITLPNIPNTAHFCILAPQRNMPSIDEMHHLSHLKKTMLLQINTGIQTSYPGYQPRHWLLPTSLCSSVKKKLKTFRHHAYMYRVKPGDTLSGIAHNQHMTLQQLLTRNHLKATSIIHPHQRLHVSLYHNAPPGHTTTHRYRVRQGDTLSHIAQRYHVTVKQIRFWNHLSHRAILHPKQTLRILATPTHKKYPHQSTTKHH